MRQPVGEDGEQLGVDEQDQLSVGESEVGGGCTESSDFIGDEVNQV